MCISSTYSKFRLSNSRRTTFPVAIHRSPSLHSLFVFSLPVSTVCRPSGEYYLTLKRNRTDGRRLISYAFRAVVTVSSSPVTSLSLSLSLSAPYTTWKFMIGWHRERPRVPLILLRRYLQHVLALFIFTERSRGISNAAALSSITRRIKNTTFVHGP